MNKIVKVKKCTILWHVYNLKISHVYSDIIYSLIADIDSEYRKTANITITRGKIKKYLRMTIDYSLPEKIILSMVNYIANIFLLHPIRH